MWQRDCKENCACTVGETWRILTANRPHVWGGKKKYNRLQGDSHKDKKEGRVSRKTASLWKASSALVNSHWSDKRTQSCYTQRTFINCLFSSTKSSYAQSFKWQHTASVNPQKVQISQYLKNLTWNIRPNDTITKKKSIF